MVYGQNSYDQLYSRTRAKGPKGTIQASDGDGCFMKTLANITLTGVLSAPYFVGDGSNLTNTPSHTLSQIIATGNSFSGNTMIASNILVGNLLTNGLYTGISNVNPVHTLDIGSNLYISDTSVSGDVLYVKGNIFTNGAFQMTTLQSNGVIFVNSSNILTTDYASFRYDPALHVLKVDDVGGGDFRLVTNNNGLGYFPQFTSKGMPLYIEYNQDGTTHYQPAKNNVIANMPCIGLSLLDYNSGSYGYMVTHGPMVGLKTSNVIADGYVLQNGANKDLGKIVYISNTAGRLTVTRPTDPTMLVQNIGIISHINGGSLNNQTFDMFVLGTGRYEDAPNFIQAAQANVYQYLSVGGALNTSANLYVDGLTSTSNLIVRNTNGAYTIASNTITFNHFGTTYKTFNVSNPPTQIKNIDFTNVIDGAQSILNIRGPTDIFRNLSNTTGSSTYTKTSLTSNVGILIGQRCIVKCITLDGNTFVNFTKYP